MAVPTAATTWIKRMITNTTNTQRGPGSRHHHQVATITDTGSDLADVTDAGPLSLTTMTVSRLQPYATTVFAEMSALAARIGAVNLGQGFPDEDGPPAMLKVAKTPSPAVSTSTRRG